MLPDVALGDGSADEDPAVRQRREQAAFRHTAREWCESGEVLGDCVGILAGMMLQGVNMLWLLAIAAFKYETKETMRAMKKEYEGIW